MVEKRITCVTGTPGTGKSTVGRILRGFGLPVIEIQRFALTRGIYSYFENGETLVIPVPELMKALERTSREYGQLVITGHLSHHFRPATSVVVLRTNPRILKDRLDDKKWSSRKVRENLEAEVLDVILTEAIDIHGEKVSELDTSGEDKQRTAKRVMEIHHGGKRYPPKARNWLFEHIFEVI